MQKGLSIVSYDNKVIAQLYWTVVAEINKDERTIRLAHGGWITMSTAKAINTAFDTANIPARVKRVKGSMFWYFENEPKKLFPIGERF